MSNLPFLAAGFPLHESLKAVPKSTGIYAIYCKVNDFVYFGSTGRSFRLRAMEHVKELRDGTHHSLILQAHWHSKGASSFEFHIVELCSDKETLVYEQRYLDLRGVGYKNKSYNLEAIAFNNSRNGSEEESLVGKKFGKLTVLEFAGRVGRGQRSWRCACDCGGEKTTTTSQLRRVNGTHSCGCLRRECRITHGLGKTPTWRIWSSIVQRCTNPKLVAYKYYAANGIKVCDRWLSIENFIADMGYRPEGATIQRLNPLGDFCPENCEWTFTKQTKPQKRLEFQGRIQTLKQWSKELGIAYSGLLARLKAGWSVEMALSTPPQKTGAQGQEYIVTSPTGQTYQIDNLAQFAKAHSLSIHSLERLARGVILTNKAGWKCRLTTETEAEWLQRARSGVDLATKKRNHLYERSRRNASALESPGL